jgi:hypothetical protein
MGTHTKNGNLKPLGNGFPGIRLFQGAEDVKRFTDTPFGFVCVCIPFDSHTSISFRMREIEYRTFLY